LEISQELVLEGSLCDVYAENKQNAKICRFSIKWEKNKEDGSQYQQYWKVKTSLNGRGVGEIK